MKEIKENLFAVEAPNDAFDVKVFTMDKSTNLYCKIPSKVREYDVKVLGNLPDSFFELIGSVGKTWITFETMQATGIDNYEDSDVRFLNMLKEAGIELSDEHQLVILKKVSR